MTDMTNTIRNTRGVMLLAGLFFLVLGIILNALLYGSFSDNSYYRSAYVSMGVGFDVAKSVMLVVAILLWTLMFYILSIFAWLFWSVLTAISVSAGFGFMSIVQSEAESAALLASAKFQAVQADVDGATRQVDNLSQYAEPLQAQIARAKTEELDTQLAAIWNAPALNSLNQRTGKTVRGQIGQCPGTSWYHGKYCSQIQALQAGIKKHQTVVDKHQTYLAALSHKEAMLKKFSELDVGTVGATSHLHPMFIGMSKLSNSYAPDVIKFFFLFMSSLVAELLGSFCLTVYGVLGVYLQSQHTKLNIVAPISIQASENVGLTPSATQGSLVRNVMQKKEVPAVERENTENAVSTAKVTQSNTFENNIATQSGSIENVATTQKLSVCEHETTENASPTTTATQDDTLANNTVTQDGSVKNVATTQRPSACERKATENARSTEKATQSDTPKKQVATQSGSIENVATTNGVSHN